MSIQQIFNGIEYKVTGERIRGTVLSYHGKPAPLRLNKTPFPADIVGLKPAVRNKAVTFDGRAYESRYTIGIEVEKNSFHRGAVKEYPLFCGFERDGSCGYEAVTHILPLLPEGKWRNKVFNMFVQAEKIIDSRYSPANSSCGGHITVNVNGIEPVDIMRKVRKNAAILYALFPKRLLNGYCNGNLRMRVDGEDGVMNGIGWKGHSRYAVAGVKSYGIEFRLIARVESVRQCFRRYELMHELIDYSVTKENGSFEAFLKHIKPIILSMYATEADPEAKVEEKFTLARSFRKFILDGKIPANIREYIDPQARWSHLWCE